MGGIFLLLAILVIGVLSINARQYRDFMEWVYEGLALRLTQVQNAPTLDEKERLLEEYERYSNSIFPKMHKGVESLFSRNLLSDDEMEWIENAYKEDANDA